MSVLIEPSSVLYSCPDMSANSSYDACVDGTVGVWRDNKLSAGADMPGISVAFAGDVSPAFLVAVAGGMSCILVAACGSGDVFGGLVAAVGADVVCVVDVCVVVVVDDV